MGVMTVSAPPRVLVVAGLVSLVSTAVAMGTLGDWGHHLTWYAFTSPVLVLATTIHRAWDALRSADPLRRRSTWRFQLGWGGYLIMLPALAASIRPNHTNTIELVIGSLLGGAGPLTIALMFFRPRRESPEQVGSADQERTG